MLGIDFDFPRYVAQRRGQVEQRARDGAAYGFSGERKLRRAVASARPVMIALEATTRLWKSKGQRDLLASSEKASDRAHPALYRAAKQAGAALGVEVPAIYVAETFPQPSATLGTEQEPVIVVSRSLVERLDERELCAVIGHELGHVQNNQVTYATALFYLQHEAMFFVRWIVQPAVVALSGWARRAEVSCDRAALIAVRDIEVALAAMVKSSLASKAAGGTSADGESTEGGEPLDVRAHLAALSEARRGLGQVTDFFRAHPHLVKRARALELFTQSALYRKLLGQDPAGALSAEDLDLQVSEIVRVFG